jgi:DNA-binding Xre family transcriptional regulator
MVLRYIKDFLSAGRRYEKKKKLKRLALATQNLSALREPKSRNLEFVSDVM